MCASGNKWTPPERWSRVELSEVGLSLQAEPPLWRPRAAGAHLRGDSPDPLGSILTSE